MHHTPHLPPGTIVAEARGGVTWARHDNSGSCASIRRAVNVLRCIQVKFVCLFVVKIYRPANSSELFPDCLKVMLYALDLHHGTVIESME